MAKQTNYLGALYQYQAKKGARKHYYKVISTVADWQAGHPAARIGAHHENNWMAVRCTKDGDEYEQVIIATGFVLDSISASPGKEIKFLTATAEGDTRYTLLEPAGTYMHRAKVPQPTAIELKQQQVAKLQRRANDTQDALKVARDELIELMFERAGNVAGGTQSP